MNRMAGATITAGLLALSLAVGCASTHQLSADEIVARNATARGGLDAWRKVETMVWSGRIESSHAPTPSMPFELRQKRPNLTRLEIDAMGERSIRVFDGVQGWKVRSAKGRPQVEPYTPQEWKSAAAGHGIDGPLLDSAAKGNTATLQGIDEIEGRKVYHLSVHLAKGGEEDVWVDAETYLDLRYDRMVDGPSGTRRRVSASYGDYRTVEGLKLPFLITTGGGQGTPPDRMKLETVLLNAPMDPATFANPGASRPRTRAWSSGSSRGPGPSLHWIAPAGAAPAGASAAKGPAAR
jgi:hypothetical protein